MWNWDQGRLDYFQFDNLKKIARFAIANDLRLTDRMSLVAATGLPFLPDDDRYQPWRNYSRVFRLSMICAEKGNGSAATPLATLLASDGGITVIKDAPWGIFGGKEGAVGRLETYNSAKPDAITQNHAKFSGLRVEPGDVVSYVSPSGGGYGDPLDREPSKVLDDVLDDFIDVAHARDVYGVVLKATNDGYDWGLDLPATQARRAEMRR